MKNQEMPRLSEVKYTFTNDDRIREIRTQILERRLKELDEERAAQDKYLRDVKMLNVIKFFKRSDDSKLVTEEEIQVLEDGLKVFGLDP